MKLAPVALFVLSLACVSGCGKSNTTKPVVDSGAAAQETTLGNQALASGDYATANAHYKAAIAKDPGNGAAQFGAGVTEVYLLKNDPDIQGVENQIPPIGNARTGIAPVTHTRGDRAQAIRDQLASIRQGVDPRYAPLSLGKATFRTLLLAADHPDSISKIQSVIRAKVMPKLQYAEERLNAAEAATDFAILLPPSVTDLPDTIEIDKTEVYLLDAVVNSLQGWCGLLVAYNFDVENGDFKHVNAESLLAAGTDWATLNPGGALTLSSARLNFLNTKAKFDAASAYLAAETDDQSNDVIPQSWLTTQEYADLNDGINQAYNSLVGPVTITVNDASSQPLSLRIEIGRLFVPAIHDLKTKFPDLTFSASGPDIALPITFPDPTINGIFPDMTNALWQQLTGLTGAALRSPRVLPVARR